MFVYLKYLFDLDILSVHNILKAVLFMVEALNRSPNLQRNFIITIGIDIVFVGLKLSQLRNLINISFKVKVSGPIQFKHLSGAHIPLSVRIVSKSSVQKQLYILTISDKLIENNQKFLLLDLFYL